MTSLKSRFVVCCIAAVGASIFASTAVAQSPEDQVRIAKGDLDFEKELDRTNEACGTKLLATIDWKSFDYGKGRYSVPGYCKNVLSGLRYLCGGKGSRAYIKKKIKTVRCTLGGEDKRKLDVSKSTVTLFIDWKASNYGPFVHSALIQKL